MDGCLQASQWRTWCTKENMKKMFNPAIIWKQWAKGDFVHFPKVKLIHQTSVWAITTTQYDVCIVVKDTDMSRIKYMTDKSQVSQSPRRQKEMTDPKTVKPSTACMYKSRYLAHGIIRAVTWKEAHNRIKIYCNRVTFYSMFDHSILIQWNNLSCTAGF